MKKALKKDGDRVVKILASAFENNKSVNYLVKQDDKREERIRHLMRYSFHVCLEFGEVWLNEDRDACALILFQEHKKTSLKTIMWDMQLIFKAIGVGAIFRTLDRESKIKSNYPKSPFAYLWFIGVDDQKQGQGKGSQLLKSLLDRYRRKGRSVYLETSTEINLPFYKRLGFDTYKTLDFGYNLFMMRNGI